MKRNGFHLLISIYRLLLYLYPTDFREEFGEEMTAVFIEAVTKASRTKPASLLIFCWRELRDYPFSLLRQHWRNLEAKSMSTNRKKAPYLLLTLLILGTAWLIAVTLWGYPPNSDFGLLAALLLYWPFALLLLIITAWLFTMTMALMTRKIGYAVRITVGLLMLALLFLPASTFEDKPGLISVVLLSLALMVVALLLNWGLTQYQEGQSEDEAESQSWSVPRTAVITFALALLLLLKVLHSLYWLLIWDSTYDPFDFLWLIFLLPPVLFAGISLAIALPDRIKWAGFSYLLLMPALIIGVFVLAQQVSFRQLTEERAARVSRALENYYEREGEYPLHLQRLIPRYILSLPEPVIIYGQAWCYDSGADYYRLGYVYREHWSDPRLSGKLHKSAGNVPDLQPLCWHEVAAIQEQHPQSQYEYLAENE